MDPTQLCKGSDPAAFFRALDVLGAQLKDEGLRAAYTRAMVAYFNAYEAGNAPEMPAFLGGPIVIAVLHLSMGTPLFITDQLLCQWHEQGDKPGVECSSCGLRLPEVQQSCALCGAATGQPGSWRRRRADRARFN